MSKNCKTEHFFQTIFAVVKFEYLIWGLYETKTNKS